MVKFEEKNNIGKRDAMAAIDSTFLSALILLLGNFIEKTRHRRLAHRFEKAE